MVNFKILPPQTADTGSQRAATALATPRVMRLHHLDRLPLALEHVGLAHPRPALVMIGGASNLSESDADRLESLFLNGLAPLAEQLSLCVVDGGTDAGIMRLMGQARHKIAGTFPCIGVAPAGLIDLPEAPSLHPDSAPLEPYHTHCFLVPGTQWGDESRWIANVATAIAAHHPSVVLLINGGDVTWHDAACHIAVGRPILVVGGSGRTADCLARALRGESIDDQRAGPLLASGLLHLVDLNRSSDELLNRLTALLG